MKLKSIYAQIEEELSWRQAEIRFFQNLYERSQITEEQQNQTRRTLVLLLYAHFEGFVKFVLSIYVDAVNGENISCRQADFPIVAAALSRVFNDMRNPDRKSADFQRSLPEDSKLHRIAREQEFVERTDEIRKIKVVIPDDYVDTESNLKPIVLKKNMYKLGLEYSAIEQVEGSIHKLLGHRNAIAHGSKRDGIPVQEYTKIFNDTFSVMNLVKSTVYKSLREKKFKRKR